MLTFIKEIPNFYISLETAQVYKLQAKKINRTYLRS